MTGCSALARLPLLDKTTAAQQQELLVVASVPPAPPAFGAGVVSSATTRTGRPLRMLLSAAEVAVPRHGHDDGEAATLEIVSPRHGLRPPSGARTLLPAALHPNTIDVTADLLASGRYATLVAPLSTLKWLTAALPAALGTPNLSGLGVRVLGATGYPVTAFTRAHLEPMWRAIVVDNWSMSELRGHAHPCPACGFSHWLGAPVWFELVDPLFATPIPLKARALGELIATPLLPHSARMPLIRYRSGDVVELGPLCKTRGAHGIRFRGRMSTSLLRRRQGHTHYALLSRDLLEVAEALPDVAFEPHPAERLGLIAPGRLGVPRARVHDGKLVVELTFAPSRHRTRAAAIKRQLAESCDGDVEILLVPPGSLDFAREARKL